MNTWIVVVFFLQEISTSSLKKKKKKALPTPLETRPSFEFLWIPGSSGWPRGTVPSAEMVLVQPLC